MCLEALGQWSTVSVQSLPSLASEIYHQSLASGMNVGKKRWQFPSRWGCFLVAVLLPPFFLFKLFFAPEIGIPDQRAGGKK